MRRYEMSTEAQIGNCFLIYGETGCGKTCALGSLPGPLKILSVEPRDPRRTLINNPKSHGKKIDIVECDNFDEVMDELSAMDEECINGKNAYKSLAFDSLTFEQARFKIDLEDSRFEKETDLSTESKKKRHETLVDRFRIETSDWGSLGSMMKRLTYLLNKISRYGVTVVATATSTEFPKWDKSLSAAPAFQGLDYGSVYHGFFDFVGLVKKGVPEPYPPTVHFISDGDFSAKSCSNALNKKGGKGPLDFEKILVLIESDKKQHV